MNVIKKITGMIAILAILSMSCQRGPHKETWGAGKPKRNHQEK